jgi:hypothetical protein
VYDVQMDVQALLALFVWSGAMNSINGSFFILS